MANPRQVNAFFERAARSSGTSSSPPTSTTRAARGWPTRLPRSRPGCAPSSPRFGELGGCPVPPGRHREHRHRGPRLDAPRDGLRDRRRPAALVERATEAQRVLGRPLGSHVLRAGPVDWQPAERRSCVTTSRRWPGWCATPRVRASAPPPMDRGAPARARRPGRRASRPSATRTPSRGRTPPISRPARRGARGRAAAGGAALAVLRARLQRPRAVAAQARCRRRGGERRGRLPSRGERKRDARAGGPSRRCEHRPDVGPAHAGGGRLRGGAHRQAGLAGARARARVPAPSSAGRRTRRLAAALLGAAVGLSADQARSATVPGANDNASGVAGVLAVASQLARERPDGLEVWSCSAAVRSRGWAAWPPGCARRAALDSATTLVLGLDTVGSGEPIVLSAEGGALAGRYRETDVAFAEVAAAAAGCGSGAGGSGPGPTRCWRGSAGSRALDPLGSRGGLPQLPPARRHARARGLRLSRGLRAGLARDRPSTRRLSPG